MKNIFLVSLLLGSGNTFGISIEKNNISIQYQHPPKDKKSNLGLPYNIKTFGLPYRIKITNNSDQHIIVDQSIVSAPLADHREIVMTMLEEVRFKYVANVWMGFAAWVIPSLGLELYSSLVDLPGYKDLPKRVAQTYLTIFGIIGLFSAYSFYKFKTTTPKTIQSKLDSYLLQKSITIQPGKSVEKLFWLKNPKDQVEINFGAIKVEKHNLFSYYKEIPCVSL